MMLPRRRAALALLLALSSCSSDSSVPERTEPGAAPDVEDVVYVGGTSDEALERLLDAKPKDDPSQYVIVDAPDLSTPIPADTPAAFEYHLASEASRVRALPPAPPAWQRPLRELLKLLGPPRVAYAHGVPFNGQGYFLELLDADAEPVLRVFTAKTSYMPAAEAWQTLVNAKQPLSLRVTSAFFENNDIRSDGGPYVGGSFEFRIE